MIEYFNFGFTFLAAICLCASLRYLWKYKAEEDSKLQKGLNALYSSLVFLEIYLLIKMLSLFFGMFGWLENFIYYSDIILNIGITPLIVILMLIGLLLLREV